MRPPCADGRRRKCKHTAGDVSLQVPGTIATEGPHGTRSTMGRAARGSVRGDHLPDTLMEVNLGRHRETKKNQKVKVT